MAEIQYNRNFKDSVFKFSGYFDPENMKFHINFIMKKSEKKISREPRYFY